MSVDSSTAVVLDSDGWIYSLDNHLSGPMLWNWTCSFGAPIWLWPGMKVPSESLASGRWAISHRMSDSFVDVKGYRHPMIAGLVQPVSVTGGGSRIVFRDPWLPPDYSYEIGGPLGGRLVSEAISGSGSVTFVIGRFGDMYTRKYDLDLAGANPIPCRCSWQEQADKPPAPNQREERTNAIDAAISLPAEDWQHQPKIPGEVSARISISQTGPAMEDRELRVEGRRGSRTGYRHKDLAATTWEFTATDMPLTMPVLADQSSIDLAAPSGRSFEGPLGGGWAARIEDFDWAQTRHDVALSAPSGREYPIRMHTTDGLRLTARSPNLDHEPRLLEGALDLSAALAEAEHGELAEFVADRLGGKPISEIWVQATLDDLVVRPARLLAAPLGTLPRG